MSRENFSYTVYTYQLIGIGKKKKKKKEKRKKILLVSVQVNAYPHVVQAHDRIGRKVGDLMAGLTVNERAVHLNPMATDVKNYKQLEPEHVLRI